MGTVDHRSRHTSSRINASFACVCIACMVECSSQPLVSPYRSTTGRPCQGAERVGSLHVFQVGHRPGHDYLLGCSAFVFELGLRTLWGSTGPLRHWRREVWHRGCMSAVISFIAFGPSCLTVNASSSDARAAAVHIACSLCKCSCAFWVHFVHNVWHAFRLLDLSVETAWLAEWSKRKQ